MLRAGAPSVRAAFLLIHFLQPAAVFAFNLDPQNTLRKDGEPGTLFGFSLAFHRQIKPDKVMLLIGAPRAKALKKQKSKVTGGLYTCDISPANNCERVEFDNEEDAQRESKEEQWMGVTVKSQGPGGKIVTCAHRYQRRQSVNTILESHTITGRCYVLSQNLTISRFSDEDGGNWNFCEGRGKDHEKFGYCQQGAAATFADHYVVFGAPGAYNWKGVVRVEQRNSTLLEMGLYDDGPYEVGDSSRHDDRLVPVPAHSYLGFSVDYGNRILPGNELTVVAGAPRANHSGAVILLRTDGSLTDLKEKHTFHGPRLASSFGYDVAVVDLNGDGWEDIAVGAPHFYMRAGDKDIGGAVYVYINKEGQWGKVTPVRLDGSRNSMFGLAVENIGDINQDSYNDLAVGAPHEDDGQGKVYIYHGSSQGVRTSAAQTLSGLEHNIRLFGYSLAGNMDLDGNLYPDLAVGSLTDAVVIYRARPIIGINVVVKTSVREIDLIAKNCNNSNCFFVEVCFSYRSNRATHNSALPISYSIEADGDRRKLGLTTRVTFSDTEAGFQLRGRETLLQQNHENCINTKATLKDNIKDKVRHIPIEVSAEIVHEQQSGASETLPRLDPILDPTRQNKAVAEVIFVKEGCRKNYICHSNLEIRCSLHYKQNNEFKPLTKTSDGVAQFVVNYERRDLALLVTVTNMEGDDAYEAKLVGTFPSGLGYSGVRSVKTVSESLIVCGPSHNGSQVECELGNPLKRNSEISFYLILSTNNISLDTTGIELNLQLQTTSQQDKPASLTMKSLLTFELPLSVLGEAHPSQVFFGGVAANQSMMKTEGEIGSLIQFTFKIHYPKNRLWDSSVPATLHLKWPKSNRDGKWLLYLMNVVTKGQEGIKCSPKSEINPHHISNKSTASRTEKEAVRKERKWFSLFGRSSQVLSMDSGITWGHLECPLLGIDGTTIELRTRLCNSTFIQDYTSVRTLLLLVQASLKLHSSRNMVLKTPNIDVLVAVSPDSDVAVFQVPWWIILLAVLAGILILALMVFLLWKCGFFKRSRKNDSVPHYHAVRVRKESLQRTHRKANLEISEKKPWMTVWADNQSFS